MQSRGAWRHRHRHANLERTSSGPARPLRPEVELLHVHVIDQNLDLCYLDVQHACLHAPEVDRVFAAPPAGFERAEWVVRLKRKVYGRRNGPHIFTEWLAIQLCQRGWPRSRLCLCT